MVSLILAIKYSEDNYYTNKIYAAIGGVSLDELNYLEGEMLKLLRYGLYVSPQLYHGYLEQLKKTLEEFSPVSETEGKTEHTYEDVGSSMTTMDLSVNNS